MRLKMRRVAAAPASPNAMMIPAMAKEATNSSSAPATLATISSAFLARSPSCGCMPLTTAGKSVWAFDQKAWTFLPTTGHSATLAGGAGTSSVCVAHAGDEAMNRIGHGGQQHGRGRHDQHDGGQRYQRGRKPLFTSQAVGELPMRRIEGHRQDEGPRHQRQEGREDPVTQRRQDEDQRGSNKDIHKLAAQALLENEIGLIGSSHCSGSSPSGNRDARQERHSPIKHARLIGIHYKTKRRKAM